MRIENRVVLITGASQGIGAACAAEFRLRGAKLALTGRNEELLRKVSEEGELVVSGDLTEAAFRRELVARTVDRYGRVDILINNAGCGIYGETWRLPLGDIRYLFELNFFAALEMIQLCVPHMLQQGGERERGAIVNVSSVAGKTTLPWMTPYSASKYALNSLSDGLRMELRREGIRVVSVCPGYVQTAFQDHVLQGGAPAGIAGRKRFAITASECARAIAEGVEKNKRTVVTPRIAWLLVVLERLLPWVVHAQLARILEQPGARKG